MKNIYSGIKPGFIVRRIYPTISEYLKEGISAPKIVKHFLESQPINVLNLLKHEKKKYKGILPNADPIDKDYIQTKHPHIQLIRPKVKFRQGMTPIFYACPHCGGRLFWGMPKCGWCGKDLTEGLTDDNDLTTYLNFLDYIYPQSDKPSIAASLSALIKDDKTGTDRIDPVEFKQILKNIKQYIPKAE